MAKNESQTIEYKQSWRNDALKAISAFANSKGGVVYIGVNDDGHPTGLHNAKKLLEDIPNTIRHTLGIIPTVERIKNDIIKITIEQSAVPISYNGKYYCRSGSTVQELQGKELANILIRKLGTTWDDAPAEQTNMAYLDNSTIEDFKRFASDRIPSIVREKRLSTIVNKLKLSQNKRLKRAALLLFGKDDEVDRLYRHACVKIGQFLSETDIKTTDIVKGNLFHQLDKTLDILRTKYLRSEIKYEGIHRRDILEYPYEALREAIINALIHRDYQSYSQIQMKKTGEITNKQYMELNKNISRITATRDLNDMVSMGFVKRIGEGKRTLHYIIDDAKMMQK